MSPRDRSRQGHREVIIPPFGGEIIYHLWRPLNLIEETIIVKEKNYRVAIRPSISGFTFLFPIKNIYTDTHFKSQLRAEDTGHRKSALILPNGPNKPKGKQVHDIN